MATGAEHYRKAEELLAKASAGGQTHQSSRDLIAAAQVHATLANAAATAIADRDLSNWIHVAWKSGSIA